MNTKKFNLKLDEVVSKDMGRVKVWAEGGRTLFLYYSQAEFISVLFIFPAFYHVQASAHRVLTQFS